MDLYGWDDTDEDLLFVQDASISGQFAQQWQLRIRAQEAALKEIARSKLRRLLACNKIFVCVDVEVGDVALFYQAPHEKSNARRRGPAAILDFGEFGATLKFQSQTLKVARYCVRRKVEETNLPQAPEECDKPINLGWGMTQPLFAPLSQPDLLTSNLFFVLAALDVML